MAFSVQSLKLESLLSWAVAGGPEGFPISPPVLGVVAAWPLSCENREIFAGRPNRAEGRESPRRQPAARRRAYSESVQVRASQYGCDAFPGVVGPVT